jgi:hypothetical protein
MKVRYFALLAFVIFIVGSNYTFALILESSPGSIKKKFHDPHEVIETYFKAVSRGELVVLDRKLDKSMLIPVRVEYVYELNSAIPIVKVYSELKQPMSVPTLECCMISGVSAILDADGHIIETEVHILQE